MGDYAKALGGKLRAIRQQQGLSLHGVEQKSGGRWKAVVVGSYERGDRAVTVQKLAELADFYGVPVAELLPEGRVASGSEPATKIVINLERLQQLPADKVGPLARYAACLVVPREERARLAQLPGIDARVGRTSTMGNDVLYHRLLLMFLKGQRDFGAMFRAARRSGDGPAALRMAHNLRTVAGSLGAQAVQASGRQLEESCNRGACEAETARLLAAVEADLAPVMAGLAALEAEAAAPPAPYV